MADPGGLNAHNLKAFFACQFENPDPPPPPEKIPALNTPPPPPNPWIHPWETLLLKYARLYSA